MSGINQYRNVFNEVATSANLGHIFDLVNVNNDDRIQFREFQKQVENVGLKIDRKECRKSYDEISKSSNEKSVTKYAWMNGINNASPEVSKIYRAILVGGQYNYQSGRSEMNLDDIAKIIVNTKAEWKLRISAMESLSRQITSPKLAVDRFHSMFRTFHDGLIKQCKERRSQVMRVACETFGKILLKWKRDFIRYAPKTIEHLYELIRQKIEIVKNTASAVVLTIIKVCPDKSRCKILDILGKEGTTSKFQHLRTEIFHFLTVYFVHQSPTLKNETKFWNILMVYTQKGVSDSVVQTRDNALQLLSAIERERPDLVKPIVKNMNDHLRKRYANDFHGQMSEDAKVTSSDYYASAATASAPRTSKKKKGRKSKKSNANANTNEWSAANAASSINTFGDDYDVKDGNPGVILSTHMEEEWGETSPVVRPSKKTETENRRKSKKRPKTPKKKSKLDDDEYENMSPKNSFRGCTNISKEELLIISRHKSLLNTFVSSTGDGNGFMSFNQFRSSLEDLGIDVRRADALQAFSIVDENEEQEISLEEFVHAVHIAMPTYNLLWKMLSKGKYIHATVNDDEYMSIAEIKVILMDKNTDWRLKSKCLRHAVLQIADPNRKGWEAGRMMKELVPALVATLRSKNQMIVRDTCLTIAMITKSKRQHVKNVIAQILKTCWELLDTDLPLITFSARFCLRLMIKYVPDDNNNKYLQTLLQGTTLKDFVAVRNSCYECIQILIRKASNEQNNDFWKCIRDCISKAIAVDEVNDDVKEWGYKCLAAFEKSNLKKAKRFIDSLDSRCQREYRLRNRKSSNFSDVDDDVPDDDENENKSADTVNKPTRGSRILSRVYNERKEQLDEAFDAYDDMGEGWLSNTRCMQFLRDIMSIESEESMIIIKGLDIKSDGHITRPRLLKWVFLHSPEMNPNPLLQKDAKIYGWTVSRVMKLEMRKDLYQQLLDIEKEDENEIGIFDIDTRLCVLKYLIQQKQKKNRK